jgi:hypothetical protein
LMYCCCVSIIIVNCICPRIQDARQLDPRETLTISED